MQQPARSFLALVGSPRIVAVPASDAEFARHVGDLANAELDRPGLEQRIRRRYPRARVRPNDLSGRDAVWYAYRDGRWESGRSG